MSILWSILVGLVVVFVIAIAIAAFYGFDGDDRL